MLNFLKEDPATREIPVIALAAHAMRGDEEKFLKAGFSGYISKPIDIQRSKSVIEQFDCRIAGEISSASSRPAVSLANSSRE
ncbi:Two-component response regulator [Methanosarcina siciliae HI350]|uniref:Two-component response regulator n=1 Tax=Methanosarcina siciliae HI350 TaxID=1434119 RepID=A0A0E3LBB1_9EURY|nr:hypothetical protein [Methanosarcina siciliae]AKB33461.1 Two-component response regulator [Methanosarcina siciliae HI350]